jgi:hypothetical protein
MTSKERLMIAINCGKPDRLPVTIHQWQGYHLKNYMAGMSEMDAFLNIGLDAAIQYQHDSADYQHDTAYLKSLRTTWIDETLVIDNNPDTTIVHHTITTPEGVLTYKTGADQKTLWITEYLIKNDHDIYLIDKYMPVPTLNINKVNQLYSEVGDKGILRGYVWGNQAGCWQHAACLMDIQELIIATFEKPDWVHWLLKILSDKKLQFIQSMKGARFDLVETGGGAASSTLISPDLHQEFCLPYDLIMHDALHALGYKTTYHTCGGTFGIEEFIVANGTDVSETLAPMSVGGNQEPWDMKQKVGNRIALIGGIDQFNTLEKDDDYIRSKVFEVFEKVGFDGGYICSASDHFFNLPADRLVAFANAAKECRY